MSSNVSSSTDVPINQGLQQTPALENELREVVNRVDDLSLINAVPEMMEEGRPETGMVNLAANPQPEAAQRADGIAPGNIGALEEEMGNPSVGHPVTANELARTSGRLLRNLANNLQLELLAPMTGTIANGEEEAWVPPPMGEIVLTVNNQELETEDGGRDVNLDEEDWEEDEGPVTELPPVPIDDYTAWERVGRLVHNPSSTPAHHLPFQVPSEQPAPQQERGADHENEICREAFNALLNPTAFPPVRSDFAYEHRPKNRFLSQLCAERLFVGSCNLTRLFEDVHNLCHPSKPRGLATIYCDHEIAENRNLIFDSRTKNCSEVMSRLSRQEQNHLLISTVDGIEDAELRTLGYSYEELKHLPMQLPQEYFPFIRDIPQYEEVESTLPIAAHSQGAENLAKLSQTLEALNNLYATMLKERKSWYTTLNKLHPGECQVQRLQIRINEIDIYLKTLDQERTQFLKNARSAHRNTPTGRNMKFSTYFTPQLHVPCANTLVIFHSESPLKIYLQEALNDGSLSPSSFPESSLDSARLCFHHIIDAVLKIINNQDLRSESDGWIIEGDDKLSKGLEGKYLHASELEERIARQVITCGTATRPAVLRATSFNSIGQKDVHGRLIFPKRFKQTVANGAYCLVSDRLHSLLATQGLSNSQRILSYEEAVRLVCKYWSDHQHHLSEKRSPDMCLCHDDPLGTVLGVDIFHRSELLRLLDQHLEFQHPLLPLARCD